MRPFLALPLLLIALTAAPVEAQVTPYPRFGEPHVTTGDVHRWEMDRLRAQADRNQDLAERQALQGRMTIQDLRARRQPPLYIPPPTRTPTPEEARRAREATEVRAGAVIRSTTQIDAWLDRAPQ